MSSAVFMSINVSLIQMYTTPDLRGRVMSIFMWTFSIMPLGLIPVSLLAEAFGTPVAFLGSAVMLVASATALFLMVPALRQLRPIFDDWEIPARLSAGEIVD